MKNPKWLFFFFLLVLSLAYNYYTIITLRPKSTHSWRQTDALSMTDNYYAGDMNFFKPSLHWVGTEDGQTAGEFPIIYYIVALLWKIFGKHEFIFRLFSIFIVFSGLYYLFKLMKEILGDVFWAMYVPLLLFTSPLLVFYTNNFLPNAPAFALVLMGWYFFWNFYNSGKNKYLGIAMFFFLLAGLLKVTALISFVTILTILFAEALGKVKFRESRKIFARPLLHFTFFIPVLAIVLSWYAYASYYNSIHIGGVFLQRINPFWTLSPERFFVILTNLYNEFLPQFFSETVFHSSLVLFIVLLLEHKKMNKLLFWLTVLHFLGALAYLALWFKQFDVHDYYLIDVMVFMVVLLTAILCFLQSNFPSVLKSATLKTVMVIMLLMSAYNCSVQNRIKYDRNDGPVKYTPFLNGHQLSSWHDHHRWYKDYIEAFETVTPYLRSLGIQRSDKVISMPDNSVNISLYLMDQKGFNDFGFGDAGRAHKIGAFIGMGAKYLIVSDKRIMDDCSLEEFTKNKIGEYRNIQIFDLRGL